jgi:hypothetical protein
LIIKCEKCGSNLFNDQDTTEGDDWEERILCGYGECIGVTGPDGRCKECGKPFEKAKSDAILRKVGIINVSLILGFILGAFDSHTPVDLIMRPINPVNLGLTVQVIASRYLARKILGTKAKLC